MAFPNKRTIVFKKVLDCIRNKAMSVQQISITTGLAWDTVNNSIKTLVELGFVKTLERNNKSFFYVNKFDIHPLSSELAEKLFFEKNVGSGLECSACFQKGYFGTMRTQVEEDNTEWIVCGWCKSIVKKEVVGD